MDTSIKVTQNSNAERPYTVQGDNIKLPSFRNPEYALKAALAIQEALRDDQHNWSTQSGTDELRLEVDFKS